MPPKGMGHVLVISQTKGFEHDSVPDAMATIWRMGHDTRLYDTTAAHRHGTHLAKNR